MAYKRAKLSGQKHLINRALLARDPVEAKAILNMLRTDHYEEWKKDLSTIATEGLQAKFRQNRFLGDYLCATAPFTIGEASKNQQWGIGLTLEDNQVLDKSKWKKQGNLLGRLLMKLRNQMINERQLQAAAKKGKVSTNSPQTNAETNQTRPKEGSTHHSETSPSNTANTSTVN